MPLSQLPVRLQYWSPFQFSFTFFLSAFWSHQSSPWLKVRCLPYRSSGNCFPSNWWRSPLYSLIVTEDFLSIAIDSYSPQTLSFTNIWCKVSFAALISPVCCSSYCCRGHYWICAFNLNFKLHSLHLPAHPPSASIIATMSPFLCLAADSPPTGLHP